MGKYWKEWQTLFSWAPKSLQMVTATMKLKVTCSLGEKLWPTSSSRVKSSHSVVSSSLRPQWTVAHQAPPSMGFSRQEYWSRLPVTNVDNILKSRDVTLPIKVYLVKTMVFPVVMLDVRVGLWRRLSTEELMLLNCGVGVDSWESLGLQGDPTSPFWRRSALGFLWKEWY